MTMQTNYYAGNNEKTQGNGEPIFKEVISVIIPLYNVERYLDRCIESVIRQTYSGLEILLVDDGSTDSSGRLCDQWSNKDPRIRVIHTENRGVASARNTGLDHVTGRYVSFVDSDDYISEDFLQKLYDALTANNADMSICNYTVVDEDENLIPELKPAYQFMDEVITGLDAIEHMQLCRGGGSLDLLWNKLYRKELFADIRFPIGKLGEDGFISHRLFGQCSRIACIHDVGYFYVQRGGSLVHNRNPLFSLHEAEARLDRMLYCYDLHLYRCAGNAYWKAAMLLADVFQNAKNPGLLEPVVGNALGKLRHNYWLRKYCTKKERVQVALVCLNPYLYCMLFRNPVWQKIKAVQKKGSDKQE